MWAGTREGGIDHRAGLLGMQGRQGRPTGALTVCGGAASRCPARLRYPALRACRNPEVLYPQRSGTLPEEVSGGFSVVQRIPTKANTPLESISLVHGKRPTELP